MEHCKLLVSSIAVHEKLFWRCILLKIYLMLKDRKSLRLEFQMVKLHWFTLSGASNAAGFSFVCFQYAYIHNNLATKINLADCSMSNKTCNFHYCQEEMWFSATVGHGISCTENSSFKIFLIICKVLHPQKAILFFSNINIRKWQADAR